MIPFLLFELSSAAAVIVPLLKAEVSDAEVNGCAVTDQAVAACTISEAIVS